jgi:hypothetical protein
MPGRTLLVYSLTLSLGCFLLVPIPASNDSPPEEVPTDKKVEPAFLVDPYLQLPTTSSMTVMWETNLKLPSRVEYGRTRELGQAVVDKRPVVLHEVALKDLEPGTRYYYRVCSGSLASAIYELRTAPPPGTKRWRMAVYGDSRSNPATHRKVVEQIAKAGVDLIVHTGDIVLNGKNHDTWRTEFFEPHRGLAHSVPWVSTIGNHERDADNYFSYMALPGNEHFFGFDYANAHIICLDSNAWIEKGRDSQQYEWLASHLKEPRPATWTFVAFHHPLFSAHATRPINSLRWDWAPIFLEPASHVDGVLTGHDHFYARNYRMGRLAEEPQPGVLFLTTAGGGASLYRTKARDYVAREKSVHHFTLFDFDGDRINVSAVSITGEVLDRFVLTKDPTPADEFCAYEVEELRRFLRLALAAAPAVPVSAHKQSIIDTEIRLPTRFRVPVQGKLVWRQVPRWKVRQMEMPFDLRPGQALRIPLQAVVEPGDYPAAPSLTIAFEPGRFHNRTIELAPFKLAGPQTVTARRTRNAPIIDGQLDDGCWAGMTHEDAEWTYSLLGLPPRGGRMDRVQLLADKQWLYVGARLNDPGRQVQIKKPSLAPVASRLVLFNEHVRVVVWDGKETHTFAVSPEQIRYASKGAREDTTTRWLAAADREERNWSVEMAIPRTLLVDPEARINIVHRRRQGKEYTDYELCPTYGMGGDPDVLPDWKAQDTVDRFGHLVIE